MTALPPHLVGAKDEARHQPGDEQLWGESYYMDFVTDDGSLGGYVRVGWYPTLGVVWWTTAIVEPGGRTMMWISFGRPSYVDDFGQGPELFRRSRPHTTGGTPSEGRWHRRVIRRRHRRLPRGDRRTD